MEHMNAAELREDAKRLRTLSVRSNSPANCTALDNAAKVFEALAILEEQAAPFLDTTCDVVWQTNGDGSLLARLVKYTIDGDHESPVAALLALRARVKT
jgi:hypothetical protein